MTKYEDSQVVLYESYCFVVLEFVKSASQGATGMHHTIEHYHKIIC